MLRKHSVAPVSELIDAHVRTPEPGTPVLGLTIGGTLVPTVWSSTSLLGFEAWCDYPKVPASVKERMSKLPK